MYFITHFKYLYFNHFLTTPQRNTRNNSGFSHALTAAHAAWLNTQNCAWFGSQISVECCELSGGKTPAPSTRGCDFRPQAPCDPRLQMLATPLG